MRKIRASVLRKVEESRLTNKELTVFLHICQYQTDAGTVSGIYYKDICNALKIRIKASIPVCIGCVTVD